MTYLSEQRGEEQAASVFDPDPECENSGGTQFYLTEEAE